MRTITKSKRREARVVLLLTLACGCDALNPAFINTFQGGQVPQTPGPEAAFVLVHGVNETGQPAEFIVTIERRTIERDEEGNVVVDENGDVILGSELQTVRLNTDVNAPANELGVLFSCKEEPIERVGLGENLLPTDSAIFLGGEGTGGVPGFGIPATDIRPLVRVAGNFACGDTIIFRAILSSGVSGGVAVSSFLLSGSIGQPSISPAPALSSTSSAFWNHRPPEDE